MAQISMPRKCALARITFGSVLLLASMAYSSNSFARADTAKPPDLSQAKELAWQGDYSGAIAILNKLPENKKNKAFRSRVLAWGNFWNSALAINTPLLDSDPKNGSLAWTQALAESKSFWPQQALKPFSVVQQTSPVSRDTRDLALAVRLPIFSSVGLGYDHYSDSDQIHRDALMADANVRVSDRLRLLAEAGHILYTAPSGGPFAPIYGGSSANDVRGLLGFRYALSPATLITMRFGSSYIDRLGSETVGNIAFQRQANDALHWSIAFGRDRVDASPLSLRIMENKALLSGVWRPDLENTVIAQVDAGRFSDGNRRITVLPTWKHTAYTSSKLILSGGLTGEYQHNSENANNGYYSPDNYRRIQPFVLAYWNLGPEVGLSVAGAVGVQRDETFTKWRAANDVSARLTLGIFTHWQLVGLAAYSQRLNEYGEYHAVRFGLQLRYRFCSIWGPHCPSIPSLR